MGVADSVKANAEEQLAGTRAQGDGPCVHPDCETGQFLKDERITRYKDGWAHVRHAAGWDDAQGAVKPAKKTARKRAAKKTSAGGHPTDESAPSSSAPVAVGEGEVAAAPPAEPNDWTVTEPGLVPDMPERVYHADPWDGSVSNSDAMLLLDSPAVYRWRRDHPGGGSRSMNLGSAAHTRVLGAGAKLVKIEDHEYRKNETKATRNAAYAAGQIPLLGHRKPLSPGTPCEWEVVDEMAAVLERDPLAPHLFADGRPEVSAFWLCPITGVKRRARFDFLPNPVPGAPLLVFPDYKSTGKSVSPASFAGSADDFGYDMQAANYEEAVVQLGLAPDARMVFVLQSTEAPYLVAVHQLTEKARERGRARTLRALRRFQHCMATGYWFGWEGVVHQVDLPAYAYTRDENDARREPVYDEAR